MTEPKLLYESLDLDVFNLSINEKTKLSFKWWTFITWLLAFLVPEVVGIILAYTLERFQLIQEYALISEWSAMSAGTFGFIYLISRYTGIGISNVVYKPIGTIKSVHVLLLGLLAIIPLSYLSNSFSFPLLSVGYFIKNNSLLAFPFEAMYYFSEIVVVTYIYIMATKGWTWRRGVFTSGTIAVILGWAILHAITKDVFTTVIAIVAVILFYIFYEYSKSPIAPIILWFAFLI